MRTGFSKEANGMEPKQEAKLTREEFEKISSEIRGLVGGKLKNHKDGDAERLLLKKRRMSSNANT